MSDSDSKRLDKKCEELTNLQNKLRRCVPSIDSVDDIIKEAVDPIPTWLTNMDIYSPIVVALDEKLEDYKNELAALKVELKRLYKKHKKSKLNRSNQNPEDIINTLSSSIKVIKEEINRLQQNSESDDSYSYVQRMQSIQDEIEQANQALIALQEGNEQVVETLQDCMGNINSASAEQVHLTEQITESTASFKQYRTTLSHMGDLVNHIMAHRNMLHQKEQQLVTMIAKLQSSKIDNEKQIRKLEEAYGEHQQLVASYHVLEDRIKKQEQQQETAIAKMVEAVELAEESAADAQKNRMTRDALTEELTRIKEVLSSTVKKFESSFSEHENLIREQLEKAYKAIKERCDHLEQENAQIIHEKEAIQRQLETTTQENSILKTAKSDNGFSHFVEQISSLKSEVEAAYSRKEQYSTQNEKLTQNINDIKGKLITISATARQDQMSLHELAQKLELELEMHKSTLKSILEKNAKLSSENTKIRNEIIHTNQSAMSEVQNKIKAKESEKAELMTLLETTLQAQNRSITEMQQAVLAYKQHADKWKAKAQSISIEAHDSKNNAEMLVQQNIDQIHALEADLAFRQQQMQKGKVLNEQKIQQIKSMKQQIAALERKSKQNAINMQQMISQHNNYQAEKARNNSMLDKLNVKIKRYQRALESLDTNPVDEESSLQFGEDFI